MTRFFTVRANVRRVIFVTFLSIFLLLPGGCRTHHHHSRNRGLQREGIPVQIDLESLSSERRAIVEESQTWFGTPYQYGDHRKNIGSDCSGMVLSVYLDATGIKLPRNSAEQAEFCKHIKGESVQPGDLVFFATGRDPHKVSHVGIMLDGENFIHVSTSKGVVISQVTTPYYTDRFMCYGRVPGM